jgi:predicted HTH domain antitoxin
MATESMGRKSSVDVPQEILDAARMTAEEAQLELAISLYAQRRLSLGKARELAGKTLWEFRQLLAARCIPAHVDEDDLAEDIATLSGRSTQQ